MRGKGKRPMSEINVVPYIDVMLVLLVIFMITTPLLSQGVHVNLPQAKAQSLSAQDAQPIIVTVDERGRYYLNVAKNPEVPMDPKQLTLQVAARLQIAQENHVKPMLLVKGDEAVNYGDVVQAMVLLQHAGAAEVGLMTETPKATA